MTDPKANLPKAKQTALGLYVTAKEAHEMWQADPDNVIILDVRTPEEFLKKHQKLEKKKAARRAQGLPSDSDDDE